LKIIIEKLLADIEIAFLLCKNAKEEKKKFCSYMYEGICEMLQYRTKHLQKCSDERIDQI
jgi:hypothetical protein